MQGSGKRRATNISHSVYFISVNNVCHVSNDNHFVGLCGTAQRERKTAAITAPSVLAGIQLLASH
jgi:hypothetical protein